VGLVGVGEMFLLHNFLTCGWNQLHHLGLAAGHLRHGYQPLGFEVVQSGAEVAMVVRQLGQDTASQTGQVLSGYVPQPSGQQSSTVFG
jgi:hypothetical protein